MSTFARALLDDKWIYTSNSYKENGYNSFKKIAKDERSWCDLIHSFI